MSNSPADSAPTDILPAPELPAPELAATELPATVHGHPLCDSFGQAVVHVPCSGYLALIKALIADGYVMLVDLCGVDYLIHPGRALPEGFDAERFEIVLNLLDIEHRRRLRVRVQVPELDPVIPSLFDLHPGSEAMEREAYDMFGISFSDHPDLTRILMPEDWEGYPLRKDYGIGEIPVQFSAQYSQGTTP